MELNYLHYFVKLLNGIEWYSRSYASQAPGWRARHPHRAVATAAAAPPLHPAPASGADPVQANARRLHLPRGGRQPSAKGREEAANPKQT